MSFALVAALALVALPPGSARSEAPAGEYDLKAAFLVNFARLVEWPSGTFGSDDAPLVIGVLGSQDVRKVLDVRVEGALVGEHPVEIQHLSGPAGVEECHLVFVTEAQDQKATDVLTAARTAAVLTVGESDGFASRGGMIGFYHAKRKIRFAINRSAADRAGFKISSRLLNLAKIVSDQD